jgi:type IV secretion system protein VirB10
VRNFFSPPDDPVVSTAGGGALGGWAGLSGAKKLAIVAAVAAAGLGVVMWPTLSPSGAPVKPVLADQHQAAPISDFQAAPPPAVQNVVARVMNDPPPPGATPARPVPTEMALYVGKAPAPVATHVAASGGATASDPLGVNAVVPTNHATIVIHPDFVIRAGEVIPCLPVDAQNSSRPSFSTCRVPSWFRGSNQRRGLMPPGTRLFGAIKTGLSAGQERLGITYSLIQTPWFNMPVASPAGDALGRGGVDGDVNTFFWDRAGAVALYALMDTTIGIGQNVASNAMSRSLANGGTTLNLQSQSQSLAGREFDATINKPPVLTRDQALPVTVTVGQDLDFYDACALALRVNSMACPVQSQ